MDARENMIRRNYDPEKLLKDLLANIQIEPDLQLSATLRGYITGIFWNHLNTDQRKNWAEKIEQTLLALSETAELNSEKKSFFKSYISIASSDSSLEMLYNVWKDMRPPENISFSERDYNSLSRSLVLKGHDRGSFILEEQLERIDNHDRKRQFSFIMPSVSNDAAIRDSFFIKLLEEDNREHEPWVNTSLGYLHHPSREDESVKYLRESLDILAEIQRTGDIFFPGQWLNNTFSGHHSKEAAIIVSDFLKENPGYSANLGNKILQSTDHLQRSYPELFTNIIE
jgi:aminopeptidase N